MLQTGEIDSADQDFVGAPITSQNRLTPYDLAINEWQDAGLNVASYMRIHKATVLAKADIQRSVGSLKERDRESLRSLMCRFCEGGAA